MVDEKVVRVECNTCGGVHNYYPPEKEKKSPSSGFSRPTDRNKERVPRKTVSSKITSYLEEWATLCADMDPERAVQYDLKGKFKVGDVISHPVFGLGIVKSITAPNKMEVLFESGMKLLRGQS